MFMTGMNGFDHGDDDNDYNVVLLLVLLWPEHNQVGQERPACEGGCRQGRS